MIFIFSGLALVGLFTIGLAMYIGIQRILNPAPKIDEKRWSRCWEEIERDISK
jgi:hypothetical protein